ncbi:MAG TPA: hypothetical protein VL334_21180, partial [Anaerolineae bacterium]|nr:hypothetical protein [Anaerolineae bacterium]
MKTAIQPCTHWIPVFTGMTVTSGCKHEDSCFQVQLSLERQTTIIVACINAMTRSSSPARATTSP